MLRTRFAAPSPTPASLRRVPGSDLALAPAAAVPAAPGSSQWAPAPGAVWFIYFKAFSSVPLFWEHNGSWEPHFQTLCHAYRDASAGLLGWAGIGSVPTSLTGFVWVLYLFQIQFWYDMDLNYWFISSYSGVCSAGCCEGSSTSNAVGSCRRFPSMRGAASPTLGVFCLKNCFVRSEILRNV